MVIMDSVRASCWARWWSIRASVVAVVGLEGWEEKSWVRRAVVSPFSGLEVVVGWESPFARVRGRRAWVVDVPVS